LHQNPVGNLISVPFQENLNLNAGPPARTQSVLNSTFIGGVQIGYNFQVNQLVWSPGIDYEYWSAKDQNKSFTYTGPTPQPNGTYAFSGKLNPDGFLVLGPRIGYAADQWLAYLRVAVSSPAVRTTVR
jgi:hypothetical protein